MLATVIWARIILQCLIEVRGHLQGAPCPSLETMEPVHPARRGEDTGGDAVEDPFLEIKVGQVCFSRDGGLDGNYNQYNIN